MIRKKNMQHEKPRCSSVFVNWMKYTIICREIVRCFLQLLKKVLPAVVFRATACHGCHNCTASGYVIKLPFLLQRRCVLSPSKNPNVGKSGFNPSCLFPQIRNANRKLFLYNGSFGFKAAVKKHEEIESRPSASVTFSTMPKPRLWALASHGTSWWFSHFKTIYEQCQKLLGNSQTMNDLWGFPVKRGIITGKLYTV